MLGGEPGGHGWLGPTFNPRLFTEFEVSHMSPRRFRGLLVASIALGLLGGFADMAFPSLIPEAFATAQEKQDISMPVWSMFVIGALAVATTIGGCVSWAGLYMFRSWAPRLALASTAVALLLLPFLAVVAQSALAAALVELSTLLWGAVLALTYYSSVAHRFERSGA